MTGLSEFAVHTHQLGHTLQISFAGSLVRHTTLPTPEKIPVYINRLEVDVSGIKFINSEGIRCWMLWIQDLSAKLPDTQLHFYRCSPMFLNNCAICKGMLPDTAEIHSFFVPMINVNKNEEEEVLVDLDKKKYSTLEELVNDLNEMKTAQGDDLEFDEVSNKLFTALKLPES